MQNLCKAEGVTSGNEIYRRYISVNYGTITNRYNKLIILILTFYTLH